MPNINHFSIFLLSLSAATHAAEQLEAPEWMVGRWCMESDGQRIEELWLPLAKGETLGLNRSMRNGRMTGFEFLRIVETEGKLVYLAQPGGRPPTTFTMTEQDARHIAFENPAHDFPQRIEYRKAGKALQAEISGPGEDGDRMAFELEFIRCEPVETPAGSVEE